MSLWDWISNTSDRVRRDGVSGLADSTYQLYRGSWRITGSRLPLGTNVYDRDWDVLVLFDGCRVDLFESVADEYDFVDEVGSITSVASTSREWLGKTFAEDRADEIAETAYVTANPYTDDILTRGSAPGNRSPFNPENWPTANASDFQRVEEVWRRGWDDDLGTVRPRSVTDRAISVAREEAPDRLIVHYMQPHQPLIGGFDDRSERPSWAEHDCWNALRRGEVSRRDVWEAYRDTLELVLDDVALLRENLDADRLVLSSDHGNALGEWGMYGHPNGFLHSSVKRVPWVTTAATDGRTHEPSTEVHEGPESSVEDRLSDLGYV